MKPPGHAVIGERATNDERLECQKFDAEISLLKAALKEQMDVSQEAVASMQQVKEELWASQGGIVKVVRRAAPLAINIAWTSRSVTVTDGNQSCRRSDCTPDCQATAGQRLPFWPTSDNSRGTGGIIVKCPTAVQRLDFFAAAKASNA